MKTRNLFYSLATVVILMAVLLSQGTAISASTPITFVNHTVTTSADGAKSVYAADVDGDGDIDILSASTSDNKIAWYENDGVSPPAFTTHVIATDAGSPNAVYAADVDSDGDIDVLSASYAWQDGRISWYENDGSSPPTFTAHVITTDAQQARSVCAADVDGDGDIDVLSASWYDSKIAWYENDGSSPPAFTTHIITTTAYHARWLYTADVDGDGDVDILSAETSQDKIAWYENDGNSPPAFTNHIITTSADSAFSVHAADVDGDGDIDALSASEHDDKIAWYESDGGSPPAFIGHVITTTADWAQSVYAVDVDADSDVDVLSASGGDDKVTWYENDGGSPPTFTSHVITASADGANSIYAADVDSDGDIDVLSASGEDDKIAWYENQGDGNAPPTVTADEASVTVDEGQTATNSGTVSDPDDDPVTLDASVGTVVNNGDGTWSWGFVTSDGPTEGQTVTISVDDGEGGTSQTTFDLTINNVAPTVDAGPDVIIDEGDIFSSSGFFTDPGADTWTATVDYGDGTGTQPLTLTGKTFDLSYTYADDGDYTIEVCVTDDDDSPGSSYPIPDTEWTRLTTNPYKDGGANWSPDGTRIAWTAFSNDWNRNVWSMNAADGSDKTQLTFFSVAEAGPYSPDGQRILLQQYYDDSRFDILVVDPDDESITPLLTDSGYNIAPDWSPDGSQIVFQSGDSLYGDHHIYTMDTDGSNVTQVTFEGRRNISPSWSPDGSKIIFSSDRLGSYSDELWNIFVMNADGSNVTQLTFGDYHDWSARISPDGTKMTFNRKSGSTPTNIYVADSDGSNITPLTTPGETRNGASWSPDGKRIVFKAVVDGNGDVYTMAFDAPPPGTGCDAITVTVLNVAPSVDAGPDQTADEGEEITFTGTFTDPGVLDTHTIEWHFGDGETVSGTLTPTHTYADDGVYTVTLAVTDDDGGEGSDSLTVTVNDSSVVVGVLTLVDHNGNGIAGGTAKWADGSWHTIPGETDENGQLAFEIPNPNFNKIAVTYNQGTVEQNRAQLEASNYTWQTAEALIELRDHAGDLITEDPGGKLDQGGGYWDHHGYTGLDGQISVEVFPGKSYKFRMTYNHTSHTEWFAVSAPGTTVVFQTELAEVVLQNHLGDPLDGGAVRYAAGSWWNFGTTGDHGSGRVVKELFQGSYKFRITYNHTTETKTQDIDSVVAFQTGAIHSDSETCTAYAGGSWRPFTQDIELLPGSRKFRFSDGTPDTTYAVEGGTINHIH